MKTLLIISIALMSMIPGHAQKTIKIDNINDQQIKTVFQSNKRDGFYGSFSSGYSPIDGKHGLVFSSRGCWIMDHWFAVGIGGTGFVNNVDHLSAEISGYLSNNETDLIGGYGIVKNLAGGYGGIFLEPMLGPLKPVHFSFPVLIGAGGLTSYTTYHQSYYDIEDFFFVIEPGIELEVNFTRWLRVAAFATYRFTSDINIDYVNPNALRTWSAGLNFKVGLF